MDKVIFVCALLSCVATGVWCAEQDSTDVNG